MSSCTHKHSFFMLILGGMLAALSFTNDSVASEGEVSCSMPIGVYNSDLLEQVEFFCETSVIRQGLAAPNFEVRCSSGALSPEVGEEVGFLEDGSVRSFSNGVSALVKQKQATFNLSRLAEITFFPNGFTKQAEVSESSRVVLNKRVIPIIGDVEFTDAGDFSSGYLDAAPSMEFVYFGRSFTAEVGDEIYRTPDGAIYVEGMKSGLEGDWTLDGRDGNLKFSIDTNDRGEFLIFLLKGDTDVLKANITDYLVRAINEMTTPFYLNQSSSVKVEFRGLIDVPSPDGEGTVSESTLTPANLRLEGEQLILEIVGGPSLKFSRDSFMQVIGNFLKALFQASVSFVFFAAFFVFGIRKLKKQGSALKNAKIDRRYTKEVRLRGGGTFQGIFIMAGIWLLVAMFGYHLILDYFRIGGLFQYLTYFFY